MHWRAPSWRASPLGSFVCSLRAMRAAATLLLCSLALCEAYPRAPDVPGLDPGLEPVPSPLPSTGESSADPSPEEPELEHNCRAVTGAAVNDAWCERSCNSAQPACPAAYCTCEGGNPTIPGAAPRTGPSDTHIEPPTEICTKKDYYGNKKCRNLNTEEVNEWKMNEQKRHAHEREAETKAREEEEVQGNIERREAMDEAEAASDAVRAAKDAENEKQREKMEADAERKRQDLAAAAKKIQEAVAEREAAAAKQREEAIAQRDAAVGGAGTEAATQGGDVTPTPQELGSTTAAAPDATTLAPDWAVTADRTASGAIVPPAVDAGLEPEPAVQAIDNPALAAANAAAEAAAAEAVAAQTEAAENAASPAHADRVMQSLAALVGAPTLMGGAAM